MRILHVGTVCVYFSMLYSLLARYSVSFTMGGMPSREEAEVRGKVFTLYLH